MMEIFLVAWDDRRGYVIEQIIGQRERVSLPSEFLELIFFKALGILERRYEPKLWTQNYRRTEYMCYYPGFLMDRPIIIVGCGPKNEITLALIDIAMRLRRTGFEGRSEIFTKHYTSILKSLASKNATLLVLGEEIRATIYKVLLENPIVTFRELMDITLSERRIPSIHDIKDTIFLMNLRGLISVKWIRGEEVIQLARIFIPTRRFKVESYESRSHAKEAFKKYYRSWDFIREIHYATNTLLDRNLKRILLRLYYEGPLNVSQFSYEDIKLLLEANYVEREGGNLVMKSFPVIKTYKLSGKKIKEFSIFTV